MIGRGAMSNPFLFHQIRQSLAAVPVTKTEWQNTKSLLPGFYEASTVYINEYFAVCRTKQWLRALSLKSPEAKQVFDQMKVVRKPAEFRMQLENLCV
jgi:tRNA-dihydrouridine synthase C